MRYFTNSPFERLMMEKPCGQSKAADAAWREYEDNERKKRKYAAPADDILHAETAADDFADQSRLHGLPSSPVQRISVTLSLPPASSAISTRRLAA